MKIKKLYNFIVEYKWAIFIPSIILLVFFSYLYRPLWVAAAVLSLVMYCFCNFGELVGCALFFGMFSAFGDFYVYTIVAAFGVASIRYIIDLIRKKQKIFVIPFILTTIFVLLFSFVHNNYDYTGFQQGLMVIGLLYSIYLSFVYKSEINIKKCFSFLLYGLITSAVLSLISLTIPDYSISIFFYDGTYYKLKLFNIYENNLAVAAIFGVAAYVYFIINNDGNIITNIIGAVLFIIAGLCTLSKMFYLLLFLVVISFLIYLITKYKSKSIKYILPMIPFLIIITVLSWPIISKVLSRFFIYGNNEWSIWDHITTGRTIIWRNYIKQTFVSWKTALLGYGIFSPQASQYVNPHSVFIYFLNRTGIIGTILLVCLVVSYLKLKTCKISLKYPKSLLLIIFVCISMVEMIFSDRFAFILILAIAMLEDKKVKN